MLEINPCNCGGIPYVAPYYASDDVHQEDCLFIVRCLQCINVGMLECTQENAVDVWNEANKSYIADW